MKGSKLFSALAGIVALAASSAAHAIAWYFQSPASGMAREIDWLHQVLMWIILVIFIGVFGFMFYACYAHRKSKGHQAAQFHENTTVEILWTVIPALILIVIAWPVTKVVIAQKDTSAADLTIKVTGYQWKWGYDYLKGEGEGMSFISTHSTPRDQIEGNAPKGENYLLEVDHEMVVPVGKKVRILTTAADVVHAWWVPAFGAKQDAVPGFIRDTWFRADREGTFRSQCVELCGKEHGFMPIVVRGDQVYAANCVACHKASGQGMPAMNAPALAASKFVTGPEAPPIDTVLHGRPNTALQAFDKQLSDTEIAAVITYARNSWGN